MLPEDVFRAQLDRTIAALRRWRDAHADCVRAEEEETANYWRLAVRPLLAGACPIEMVLHHRQSCDLAIAGETYEDRPVDEIERLPPLAEAISAGRVLTRLQKSANTGACLAIATHIRPPDGLVWQAERWLRPDMPTPHAMIREDRWYLPYRRT